MKKKQICLGGGSIGENEFTKQLLEEAIAKVDVSKLSEYDSALGMDELREAVADFVPFPAKKGNVMITSGSQQSLNIVFNDFFADEHRPLRLQQPCFFGTVRLLHSPVLSPLLSSRNLYDNNWKDYGLSYAPNHIYLSSNFQNPTGKSLHTKTKKAIAKASKRLEFQVIEDNPYDQLYYTARRPTTIYQHGPHYKSAYLGSFSKILGPGLRLSYIISSKKNIKILKSVKIDADLFTSTLNQQVCLNILKSKSLNELLNNIRKENKTKRDAALLSLKHHFSNHAVTWNKPKGGIYIEITLPGPFEHYMIHTLKHRYNLVLDEDKFQYYDEESRNTLRINFVQNKIDVTEEGISRLAKCYEMKNSKKEQAKYWAEVHKEPPENPPETSPSTRSIWSAPENFVEQSESDEKYPFWPDGPLDFGRW